MKEDNDDSDSSVESSYSGLESEPDTSGHSDIEENSDEETVSCLLTKLRKQYKHLTSCFWLCKKCVHYSLHCFIRF